ncbi:MAG TPA: AIM24 family protein [Nonomuraea sp.]|nr:AIM24 family protein [Nonomuraea sp.]
MRSSVFGNLVGELPGGFVLENSKMLRVHLPHEVLAKQGSMVAFQGRMDFDYEGSGVSGSCSRRTFADGQSAVCWSTGLQVGVNRTMKAGALIGRGSGEAMQLAFTGQGFVLVQASEGAPVVTASRG